MRPNSSFVVGWFLLLATPHALRAQEPAPEDAVVADADGVTDLRTRRDGDDWPQFLGPTGDGKSAEKGILTDWPEQGPKLLWQKRLGSGYASPATSRGRLFYGERIGGKARLICVNAETGDFLWKFEYPSRYEDLYDYDNGPRCQPVVDGDRVYMYGAEGMLYCLSVMEGKELWKVDTVEKFGVIQNFFGVASTPVLEGDLLIVQVGGSPPESQATPPRQLDRVVPNGSGVVAFDKCTGEVKYKTGDELASYASPKLATIDGRRWCFLFARGGLLAFNPTDGKIDFHYPWRARALESVNASDPVVVNDLVFISETYGPGSSLLKVRPGGYDVVWSDKDRRRDKSLRTHWNTPIHHNGYLYACSGRHTGTADLRCVELATGKVMWVEPMAVQGMGRSTLMYVDGHFVCLTEFGAVMLLKANPRKFDVVARTWLPSDEPDAVTLAGGPPRLLHYPAWAAPILSHGLLYLRGEGRLACVELIPKKRGARRDEG